MKRVKTGLELEGPLNLRNNHLQNAILSATDLQFEDWAEQHQISDLNLLGNTLILEFERALPNGIFATETKTVNLTPFAADVQITGATITQPSAGVWMLNIAESNGDVNQVNLSDLVAIVTADSGEITFSGNGTAANRLTATLNAIASPKINMPNDTTLEQWYDLVQNFINLMGPEIDRINFAPKSLGFNVDKGSILANPASEVIVVVPYTYFPLDDYYGNIRHYFSASVRQVLDLSMYSEEIVTTFTIMRNDTLQQWEFNFGMFNNLPGGVDEIQITIFQNRVVGLDYGGISFRPV
jgi:hypothetical protein